MDIVYTYRGLEGERAPLDVKEVIFAEGITSIVIELVVVLRHYSQFRPFLLHFNQLVSQSFVVHHYCQFRPFLQRFNQLVIQPLNVVKY